MDLTSPGATVPRVLVKIQTLGRLLDKQGSLVQKSIKGNRYWYLRYYDRTGVKAVQRSLYVGKNPTVVEAVRTYLRERRQFRQEVMEVIALAKVARRLGRLLGVRRRAS